jgi:hypothetical protein
MFVHLPFVLIVSYFFCVRNALPETLYPHGVIFGGLPELLSPHNLWQCSREKWRRVKGGRRERWDGGWQSTVIYFNWLGKET